MTQNEKIVEFIERNGSITSRDAMLSLNIYRLASRINELRKIYDIETVNEQGENGKYYARYFIKGVKQ